MKTKKNKSIMGIHFRGGEYQQKGKGIGGFFRGLVSLFKPMVRSVGSSVVKAATSKTAKSIAKTLGEQALDSSMNMTKDMLQGNDLRESLHREMDNFKRKGSDIVDEIQKNRSKKKRHTNTPKKGKVTLRGMRRYESRPRPY